MLWEKILASSLSTSSIVCNNLSQKQTKKFFTWVLIAMKRYRKSRKMLWCVCNVCLTCLRVFLIDCHVLCVDCISKPHFSFFCYLYSCRKNHGSYMVWDDNELELSPAFTRWLLSVIRRYYLETQISSNWNHFTSQGFVNWCLFVS